MIKFEPYELPLVRAKRLNELVESVNNATGGEGSAGQEAITNLQEQLDAIDARLKEVEAWNG